MYHKYHCSQCGVITILEDNPQRDGVPTIFD